MARNFIKNHGDDHAYLKSIALLYANSNASVTMDEVAKKFSISRGNVETAIELAITENLISYQDSLNIRTKSDCNQHTHYTEKLSTSEKSIQKSHAQHRYDKLLLIRKNNIIKNCTAEEILHAVRVYIKNPKMENVFVTLGLSKEEMNGVFKKGAFLGIISEEDFDTMRRISLSKSKTPLDAARACKAQDHIASLRRDRKLLVDTIALYQDQSDKYDDFSQDPDFPFTKEELDQIVKNTEERLELFDKEVLSAFLY